MKKRGFGEGRWNGFGGKVHEGETVEDAILREVYEEAQIRVRALRKVGRIEFSFSDAPLVIDAHIFHTTDFTGNPKETEEMRPEWFPVAVIPYEHMWPDDVHWFPLLLAGKKFRGKFHFGPGQSILEQELHIVETL